MSAPALSSSLLELRLEPFAGRHRQVPPRFAFLKAQIRESQLIGRYHVLQLV